MSDKSHFAALEEISNWNTDDVIGTLKDHGLSECVEACQKRNITGRMLLELSEVTLVSWKCDLSVSNIRKLATFVQEINKMPTNFSICSETSHNNEFWETDWEDENEEENCPKAAENNIPQKNREQKPKKLDASLKANGPLSVQNLVDKNYNSQNVDQRLSSVYENRASQNRNKINIPLIFTNNENGAAINSSKGSVPKPDLKTNGMTEHINGSSNKQRSAKPAIASRPPPWCTKTLSEEKVQSDLPKPPAFNEQGLILRKICYNLPNESDYMDELGSFDEDLLQAESINNQKSHFSGTSPSVSQYHSESPRKSPVFQNSRKDLFHEDAPVTSSSLHRNQSKISQKINMLSQQISKTDQNSAVENLKKSPVFIHTLTKNHERTFQQEKPDSLSRSPVPLPPRNEVRHNVSPTSTLNLSLSKTSQKTCEDVFASGNSRLSKDYDDNDLCGEKEITGISEEDPHEEVYECIPEQESRNNLESCQEWDGYLLPKTPSTSGKMQTNNSDTPSEKANNAEFPGTPGTSKYFNSLKYTSHRKTPEKSSQDGKRTNTLPMPRPYISESPRPSATRPLPPPPPPADAGIQRVVRTPLEQMPWYFNVDRAKGEEILRTCEDGAFMIRPSTKTQNGLTLTLKYGKRPFNICVRRRPDGKYALGTMKPTEQIFSSIEELINHYSANELLLYSNGKHAGIVVLTSPPRKDPSNQ